MELVTRQLVNKISFEQRRSVGDNHQSGKRDRVTDDNTEMRRCFGFGQQIKQMNT